MRAVFQFTVFGLMVDFILGGITLQPSNWALAAAPDRYASYTELSHSEKEGKDFEVEVLDRKSPTLILAIHGGWIEAGTGELARSIAGGHSSIYIFRAIKAAKNWDLHVTGEHFDDPRALALAKKSKLCVSLHGFKGGLGPSACLGGGNLQARDRIAQALRKSDLSIAVETPCTAYGGANPMNITNRCTDQGVQIELSAPLRKRFESDPQAREAFIKIIQENLL